MLILTKDGLLAMDNINSMAMRDYMGRNETSQTSTTKRPAKVRSEGRSKNRRRNTIILLCLIAFLFLGGGIIMFFAQSYTIVFHSTGGEALANLKANGRENVRRGNDLLPIPISKTKRRASKRVTNIPEPNNAAPPNINCFFVMFTIFSLT